MLLFLVLIFDDLFLRREKADRSRPRVSHLHLDTQRLAQKSQSAESERDIPIDYYNADDDDDDADRVCHSPSAQTDRATPPPCGTCRHSQNLRSDGRLLSRGQPLTSLSAEKPDHIRIKTPVPRLPGLVRP